jgi:group I intron endonuclease
MVKKRRYKNPISCVYKITFKKYIYIGSTTIFSKRKYEHLWALKKNIHTNPILQNIYNKHSKNEIQFSIIEIVSIDKLIETEQKYINIYKEDKTLKIINILLIAGSSLGHKQTEETCEKKRKSMVGKHKGTKRSPEYCAQQSINQKGRIISDEWRKKISNSLKGRKSPNKPKKFIKYNGKIFTFKDFSIFVNCDLSTLYVTKREYTERKYNCKIIEQGLLETPSTS